MRTEPPDTDSAPSTDRLTPAVTHTGSRRVLCDVLCGVLALGVCLQAAAALAAIALAVGLISMAIVAGSSPWIGVGVGVILMAAAALATCAWADRRRTAAD